MTGSGIAPSAATSSVSFSTMTCAVRSTTRSTPVVPTIMWCASSFSMNSQVRLSGSNAGLLQRAELVLAVPVGEVGEHEERQPVRCLLVERAQDAGGVGAAGVAVQQFLGLLPALPAEVGVQQVHHRPQVTALLHVDLEQVAQVVQGRGGRAEVALLLDGGGLGVALDDDQPLQLGPVLPGHLLPGRLALVRAERDPPVRARARPGRSPTGSPASARGRSAPSPRGRR